VGCGSEFVVQLPLAHASQGDDASAPKVDEANIDVAPGRSPRRVLVVEDNVDSARTLTELVQLCGHQAMTVHDGARAIEAATTFAPDVVLLDIGLPRVNGYDACQAIRALPGGRGIVIAALTGWGQEEDRRRSRAAGFDVHLVKPVDIDALMQVIELDTASDGRGGKKRDAALK
jgi:CheY-like chemotaxis protein